MGSLVEGRRERLILLSWALGDVGSFLSVVSSSSRSGAEPSRHVCGVSIRAGVGLGTPFAWVEAYFAVLAPQRGRRMCDKGFALGRSRSLGT